MAIRFILGRAGSGKTHHCLEAVRGLLRQTQRGPTLVLLVPEQATYQIERALVTTPDLGGYCRARVLSFRRLAYHVFLEVGGAPLPALDPAGKQMVLRSILKRRRAELRLFAESARQRGFVERLAATLNELHAYGHWADRLRAQLARLQERGKGDELLAMKLHDLALVVEDYERFLAGSFVDPDSHLDLLAERLAVKNPLHGSLVWVDGFASFTGQEERVLATLMRVCGDMHVALCLDPDRADARAPQNGAKPTDLSIFSLLEDTYDRLQELARESGQSVLPLLRLPQSDHPTRFSRVPVLAHIERNLFAVNPEARLQTATPNVLVTEAADQRCEVRAVADEILRLCREEGYCFRDAAVIVRDLGPYRALIETIFRDREIPHFVDVRRDVAHHPLIELIRAALDVVVYGWRSRDVFRYAKTDLAGLARAAVDRLENYVLAHGIEGSAWHEGGPWQFHHRYSLGEDREFAKSNDPLFEEVNQARRLLAEPLRRFDRSISGQPSPLVAMCRALYVLLDALDAAPSLDAWAAEAERQGRLDAADEHRQAWGAVVSLLDQAVAALGNEPLTAEEFREIIEAGLAGIRLRLVPPALDQVLVGSIERSRHPEIRVAFVLGMNERTFPTPHVQDVVFSDRERESLAEDGVRLGPVSEQRLLHERFLAYIALTRPSERLYVSYAEADPMGKVLHPSPFLDDLRRCLPELKAQRADRDEPLDRIGHWRSALAGLCAALRPGKPTETVEFTKWAALYDAMRSDGRLCDPLARRVGGFADENRCRPLGAKLAERLYGADRESSVSRLECFAACPFKHFARYGLRLEDRRRFRLDPLDLGLLYHEVLKQVFDYLSGGRPLDWATVDPQRATDAVIGAVGTLAPMLRNEILHSTARNRYVLEATRAALVRRVQILIEASRRDRFHQVAAEIAFGGEAEVRSAAFRPYPAFGPLDVDLGDGRRLRLRGRIDRVDLAGDAPPILRIIDYKTRARPFRLVELAHGLSLQLPAYLLAMDRVGRAVVGENTVAAGALYLPILRKVEPLNPRAANQAAEAGADLGAWKARGFFDLRWADRFDADLFHGDEATRKKPSPVIGLRLTRDGQPWGSEHDGLPEDGALTDLLKWTERVLADLGRRIADGEIDVAPYQLGSDTPCPWCEFRAVCRFDAQRQPYRVLPTRRRQAALDWIREQVG